MRTETINVYSFDELSEEAKKVAINDMRALCMYEHVSRDWDEARPVLTEFLAYVGLTVDFKITPEQVISKGSYYKSFVPQDDVFTRWITYQKYLGEKYGHGSWYNDMLYESIMNSTYDNKRSLASNLCSVVVIFCGIIDHGDPDYFDDNAVIDYINECCVDFLQNGIPYEK